ncbi:outer membrane beta-barrel protein [Chryseobacterium tructae]|uniref:Outer membrane beta-barrel protein n=1 Tax=Chryseobacterium tructae TaxID=1037380 RepID=A0ABV7XSN1_9FLAO|nr:outer membrane beta-barrel protein [Chryseobacterium tructae]MDN3691721.1 outer membrane beta-barrel protein [Chryseobacterium tructae]
MKKILLLLFLICNVLIVYSQRLYIDGKVSDPEKKPVEDATVYLLKAKDSSIINYTSSNKEGKFSLQTDEVNEASFLKIDTEKLSYSKALEKINKSLSLGDIELEKKKVITIDEVKITVSPVKIKNDTIEFNASALKVRPDSQIDELLKQIPGVEIGNDGKITVNGKAVDQIMVNGKPFFDKEGKTALQNLPADIIKNIQFTTTKTKEEELSKRAPKSQNTTINFNIDEKKNKGLISKILAGYGSDKRYEGNTFLNYFKGDTKISVLASANNINSKSSSGDQIFDTMGRSSGGQGGGIQKFSSFGLNYNDKFGKDANLENLSLQYTNSDNETRSKASKTTLLPDFTLKTDSESRNENESKQYNFNSSVGIKLDSLTNIYIAPSFSKSETLSTGQSTSSTLRDDKLLNESKNITRTKGESNSFSPNINFFKNFKKKNRSIMAMINTTISESNNDNINQSLNTFYKDSDMTTDNRNQLQKTRSQDNNYSFMAKYTEPISDSATIGITLQYNSKLSKDIKDFNDFDPVTGQYSQYNSRLSNSMDQRMNQFSPELSYYLYKKKFGFWATVNADISDMNVNSVFDGKLYNFQKSFVLPKYSTNFRYSFADRQTLTISNSSSFTIPDAGKLIPFKDESNPLITNTGNPDLKNTWTNESNIAFNSYNMVKNLNYYVMVGFTYRNNDVINYSKYDNSGRQIITYSNISGNKNLSFSFGLTKTFKWNDHKLRIAPRFGMNYNYNNGFINGEQFKSRAYNFNPGLNLNYEIKDIFTIKPSYSLGYSFSNYTNYNVNTVNTTTQSLRVEMTNYLFQKAFFIGNDFSYNTNSNIAPGFKKDFYFWNASLGYSFYNKQLTAKIKVYDVLNQNQSVKRTITDSYFEDREDLILKRYIMFSLSMKLNKFAGKKSKKK